MSEDINANEVDYQFVDENNTTDENLTNDENTQDEQLDVVDDDNNIDDETDADDDAIDEDKPKKINGVQKAINKAKKAEYEAKEENARLKAENEALRQASIKQEPILEEPDLLNYDDTEEYKADLKKFYKQQADIQVKQELQIKPKVDNYNATLAKVREANPSFQANLNALDGTDAPSDDNTLATVNKALIDSEHGAFLLNEIVKDKAKAVELFKYAKNDPARFYQEIGRINERLSLSKTTPSALVKKQQLANPINPVNTGGGNVVKNANGVIDLSGLSQAQYEKYMNG